MNKKCIIIIVAIILALILLFPMPIRYMDGGSVEFRSIVNLYSITKLHELRPIEEGEGYRAGIEIRVFGLTVYQRIKTAIPLT